MKTIIKSIACALALTTTVAFAHPTEDKTSTKNRPEATFESSTFITADANIRVAIKKNIPQRVYLTLKDANGYVVFTQAVDKNQMDYATKINVSDLEDGAYQLEIASGKNRIVKSLNLSSKKVEVQRKITVE